MDHPGPLRLEQVEPALRALEHEGVRIPIAIRLAVDQLLATRAPWPYFELVEALTALVASSEPETHRVRAILQRELKFVHATSPAPEQADAVSGPIQDQPLPKVSTDLPRPSAPTPSPRRFPIELWGLFVPLVTSLLLTGLVVWDPGPVRPPTVEIVEDLRPEDACPPPEVRAVCPPRIIRPQGTYTVEVKGPPTVSSAWPAGLLALVAITIASLLTYRIRQAGRLPILEPEPTGSGPEAIALALPDWPPLLTADERIRLSWGAGRFVSDAPGRTVDIDATIHATVHRGGFPVVQQVRAKRERAIWVLEDQSDRSLLRRPLAKEILQELATVGIPHRHLTFTGDLASYVDPKIGEVLTLDELEDQAHEAAVVVLSNGAHLHHDGQLRPVIRRQLLRLASLPRLAWVDSARTSILPAVLRPFSVTLLWPEALPTWLVKGEVHDPRPQVPTHAIDVWAGLLLRYLNQSPPAPQQALALAQDLALPWVRELHISSLWARSLSLPFHLPKSEVKRVRAYAQSAFPSLWRAAGEWWASRYQRLDRQGQAEHPDWARSGAAQQIRATLANMTLEDWDEGVTEVSATTAESAAAALYTLPTFRAQTGWLLSQHKLGTRKEDLPRPAQRMLAALLDPETAEPRPPSLRLRFIRNLAWGMSGGASIAALALFGPARASGEAETAKIEFVQIPGGDGCIGSPTCEKDRFGGEGLLQLYISNFALATTETTRAAFEGWRQAGGTAEPSYEWPSDQHPATGITWNEARAFCQSLGEGFDLPTEAQWEYAARAGTTTRYFFGDDEALLKEYAWFNQNSESAHLVISEKKPNPLGLHAIYGNVDEWVLDAYVRREDPHLEATAADLADPCMGCDDTRRPVGADRVFRGGSFIDGARGLRSAFRFRWRPGSRIQNLGFRCAGPFLPSSDFVP